MHCCSYYSCPHWLQHSRLQWCFLRGRPALLSTLAATLKIAVVLSQGQTCIAVHIGCNTQDCSCAFSGADLHCCPHWLQHSRLQLCFLRGRPALLSTLAATLKIAVVLSQGQTCIAVHIGCNTIQKTRSAVMLYQGQTWIVSTTPHRQQQYIQKEFLFFRDLQKMQVFSSWSFPYHVAFYITMSV